MPNLKSLPCVKDPMDKALSKVSNSRKKNNNVLSKDDIKKLLELSPEQLLNVIDRQLPPFDKPNMMIPMVIWNKIHHRPENTGVVPLPPKAPNNQLLKKLRKKRDLIPDFDIKKKRDLIPNFDININDLKFNEIIKNNKEMHKQDEEEPKDEPIKPDDECTANVVFYQRCEEDEKVKKGTRITKDKYGRKYIQRWAAWIKCKGDLTPYRKKKIFDYMKKSWRTIIPILETDEKAYNQLHHQSYTAHLIVFNQIHKKGLTFDLEEEYQPLDDKLYADILNRTIYSRDISYKLNERAKNFFQLFDIGLNKYTLDNYKANSCYLNLLIDTYKDQFDKKKDKNGYRLYKELTYESICETIGMELKNENMGLAIRQSLPFFEKYRLGLDVVNYYGELLFRYTPEVINVNISPCRLRIMLHNNHPYLLDWTTRCKLAQMAKTLKDVPMTEWKEVDQLEKIVMSNKYSIL